MFFDEPFGGVIPGARGSVLAALLRTGTALTGRQLHRLVGDRHSLWTVQQALHDLTRLGLITTDMVGRAGIHRINERHYAIAPLRRLLSPLDALTEVARDAGGDDLQAVILFGSIARGDARADSDIDLVVIAPAIWDRRAHLVDEVRSRLGNDCDVLHFTSEEFALRRAEGEPVIAEIDRDGVALIGAIPPSTAGAVS
ncbi:MAG TPA: nucleotidyltransferase domain-containing protein [Nakamurella sp.]